MTRNKNTSPCTEDRNLALAWNEKRGDREIGLRTIAFVHILQIRSLH